MAALGADSKVFRKRHLALMNDYDWRIATDVATYEALQSVGLLPKS